MEKEDDKNTKPNNEEVRNYPLNAQNKVTTP